MVALAIAAAILGAATLFEIGAYLINQWNECKKEEKAVDNLLKKHNIKLSEEDKFYMSFEEFSEMMRNKETMKLG